MADEESEKHTFVVVPIQRDHGLLFSWPLTSVKSVMWFLVATLILALAYGAILALTWNNFNGAIGIEESMSLAQGISLVGFIWAATTVKKVME